MPKVNGLTYQTRVDPKNDPFRRLNDPRNLDNTAIGTLRVVRWGKFVAVARMDHRDPTRVRDIVHYLKRGENPSAAVFGKRTFEQASVRALYNARDEAAKVSEEREWEDMRGDFQRELEKHILSKEDGDEAVAGALGAPVQLADGSFMTFRVIRPEKVGEDG